ncbi:Shedu anti-phage system protein SduA domain-containing protein [Paenibacillus odorifer]|uniref:Shedu protein SduA C-terminal domain-containing protein n=1 Tax=Paenibacillus odorifer TaxID=189426 RepID=A0A1R0XYJ7_9BACL|nr:Shedu anti-phage system protein SduA domain-containing protein [Paenibacillus odorifer]OMD40102.1 hypothetical protein BSK52_14515 [Paenibacillus odorifer]
MSLYSRDYTKLTEEERTTWEAMKQDEKIGTGRWRKRSRYREYPKAARHFMSLFPNNFLDVEELREEDRLNHLTEKFLVELDKPDATEASIMRFIKQNQAYFIIGSILKDHNFGHHEAYVIPEFWFGNTYRVDYLIIGKRSGGYEFILVELEHPKKDITIKDGELGAAFRKGIKQINEWKRYLEPNFPTLEESFNKYKHPNMELPREFLKLDKTRIHYTVVAGRREDFDENTYWIQRNMKDNDKISLLHFDNLYDNVTEIIGRSTY